jgi:hypothetical protein
MTFKCDYCESPTHEEVDCGQRKADRRTEVALGCFMAMFLVPFVILGGAVGAIWGAARSGFKVMETFWPEAWSAIRGKKQNGGSGGGETG